MTLNYADTVPGYSSAMLNGRRFLYRGSGDLWEGYFWGSDTGLYARSRDELLADAMEYMS